jgi:putative endonuclease
MGGYIYLLQSKNNPDKFYLGSTSNPAQRMQYHNIGKNKSTALHKPWKCLLIIYIENIDKAKQLEYYIKKQKEKLSVKNVIKLIYKFQTANYWSGSSVG